MVSAARVLASLHWAPSGPLPRRPEPLPMSSIARPGPSFEHTAASRVRTLPDGAVCVLSAPSPEYAALYLDGEGARLEPLQLAPAQGGGLVDFLGDGDGTWTTLELVPGPPDRVLARCVAGDGTAIWELGETAGEPQALSRLLGRRAGAVLALTAGPPVRIVAIDGDGRPGDVLELAESTGGAFLNGEGQVGFAGYDNVAEARTWATVDIDTGERTTLGLGGDASALDVPLGIDAEARPYGYRQGSLVRVDSPGGQVGWELPVAGAVVDGERVWVSQPAPDGAGVVAHELSAPGGEAVSLNPGGEPRRWRLAGLSSSGAFLLHAGGRDGGTVATLAPDGTVLETGPAPADVWLRSFELQLPAGPAVTDAGEVDIAVRGPDALHLIRISSAA